MREAEEKSKMSVAHNFVDDGGGSRPSPEWHQQLFGTLGAKACQVLLSLPTIWTTRLTPELPSQQCHGPCQITSQFERLGCSAANGDIIDGGLRVALFCS